MQRARWTAYQYSWPVLTKVALSGSHGTGKSTLLAVIASRLRAESATLPEVPRAVCDDVADPAFLKRGSNTPTRQLVLIAEQIAQESRSRAPVLFTDRSVVDHWAYSRVLFPEWVVGVEGRAVSQLVDRWAETYSAVVYLAAEIPLEADEVREDDDMFRNEIDVAIREDYARLGVSFIEVCGSVSERLRALQTSLREAGVDVPWTE